MVRSISVVEVMTSKCGHCGNDLLFANAYYGYRECFICGWNTDSPDRAEREEILLETSGNDDLFKPVSPKLPFWERGADGKGLHSSSWSTGIRLKASGQDMSQEVFMRETVSVWWMNVEKGTSEWSGESAVEIPITIVYRRADRKRVETALVEEMIFELGDVPWPHKKMWEIVKRKFKEKTGLRLLRLSDWIALNQPVEEETDA